MMNVFVWGMRWRMVMGMGGCERHKSGKWRHVGSDRNGSLSGLCVLEL